MNAKAVLIALCLATGAGVSWWATSLSYDRDIATLESSHAQERADWANAKKEAAERAQADTDALLKRVEQAQQAQRALDDKYTQELLNAQTENAALKRDVADGRRRVSILTANIRKTANVYAESQNSATSGVGDGTALELTGDAGQLVLDLRAAIKSDHAKIAYLQGYARDVVKQCEW